MNKSDIIIIGTGPGGYRAAAYAASLGKTVTIFEQDAVGGTCLNRGCIPTKSFCRNAEIIDTLRHANEFGLDGLNYTLDFSKVLNRKNAVVEQLRNGVEMLLSSSNITLVRGAASFRDKTTVEANNELYTAADIIIATGSKPKMPPIEGINLPGVVTSTELLEVSSVPRRLCIVGAGVIGMEFASAFSSFGSEVTVVEFLKEALPTLDSDIAKRLRQTIAKRGVSFHLQAAVSSMKESQSEAGERQLTVYFEKKGKPQSIDADLVLVATGRAACTDGLNLEAASVATERGMITTDDDFLTSTEHIYAIGDVNGRSMLAHAATFQGLHVVNKLLGLHDEIRPDIMPSAIFTHPEAASVGLSEDQCEAQNIEYECHKGFLRANGKALAMGETDGLVKLITAKDGRILGCHAFGAHTSDMVQEVAALMNKDATVSQLSDIIHIHPTLSETLHDAAMEQKRA